MKKQIRTMASVLAIAASNLLLGSAHAAGTTSLSGLVGTLNNTLSALPLGSSNLGSVSLSSVGLGGLPVVGAVAGTVNVTDALFIVHDLSVLQTALPLPGLGPLSTGGSPSSLPGLQTLTALPGLSNVLGLVNLKDVAALNLGNLTSLQGLESLNFLGNLPVVGSAPVLGSLQGIGGLQSLGGLPLLGSLQNLGR